MVVMMIHQFETCVLFSIILVASVPWSVQHQNQPHLQQQQHQNQPHHQQQRHQPAQGGHGHHGRPLEFASEIHNADHILEHLQNVVTTKSKEQMTEEELEFHYFKLHDYDNNNKLDGVEIGKALTHIHEGDDDDDVRERPAYSDEEIAEVIDAALLSDDLDGDGYVEYPEFMAAQARRYDMEMSEDVPPSHREAPQPPGHQLEETPKPPGF